MTKYTSFDELKQDCKNWVEAGKKRGAQDGLKKLLTELYPDKAHFIYELLQNAEDKNASEVSFDLYEDKLVFSHNGTKRDFTLDDIDAITNIGHSTSADDPTAIGQFGVGFKAVYAYTDTPEIHSGAYDFKIIDMLVPEDDSVVKTAKSGFTQFIFPFNNPKKPPELAVSEIKNGLEELDETALLFLTHINHIKYKLPNNSQGSITIEPTDVIKFLYKIERISGDGTMTVSHWCRFSQECPIYMPEKGVTEFPVSIAYRMKLEDSDFKMDSSLIGKVCIFFPSDIDSSLHFHINAPFASTVARDNIRNCDENDKLIEALANLTVESLYYLRDKKLLNYSVYETLPELREYYSDYARKFYKKLPNWESYQKNKYAIFADKIYEEFLKYDLFITEEAEYSTIQKIFKAPKDIKLILPAVYVNKLYGRNWIPTVPSVTRVEQFIDQFPIEEYTIENLIDSLEKDKTFFNELWMRQKNSEYFKTFYYQLSQSRERNRYSIFDSKPSRNEILNNVEFILCEDKELHRIKDNIYLKTDYQPKHYLKNPLYVDLSLKNTAQDREIKQFLVTLGIQEMSESADMGAGLSNDNESVLIVWLDILKQFDENPESILQYKEQEIFLARKPNDSTVFRVCATNCCWSKEVAFFYKDKYVFAEDCYTDINKHISKIKEIFVKLDGNIEPKIVREYLDDDYPLFSLLKRERERYDTCTRTDYTIAEFDWNKLATIKVNSLINEALILWKLILRYNNQRILHIVYQANSTAAEQNSLESSLVYYLKRTAWVPTKSGVFKCPYELTDDDLLEEFIYEKSSTLLDAISVKPNDVVEQLKNKGVQSKELLVFAGLDSDIQAHLLTLAEQLQEQKRKTGKSLSELAATSDRNQSPEEDEDDDYGTFHKPKNIDKRKLKLEKEFDDREDLPTFIKKLQFVLEKPNTEEKSFVRNEYHAHCQLCGTEGILTAKGKRYFEAINIFNTGKLDDSLQIKLDLGWNTLCLCPNCAAKFKYSQLTISGLIEQVEHIDVSAVQSAFIDISITLENKPTTIRFTSNHLLALQVAIKKIKEIEKNS